jgi:Zn-dependent peptidase ImmA (M78 family)
MKLPMPSTSNLRGQSGAERLTELEIGKTQPSPTMLRRMAERYRRPLVAFYLKEPPQRGERGEDFRRMPGTPPTDFDPHLDALIRNVRARHDLIKSLLEDEEAPRRDFVGSQKLTDATADVASSISATIEFKLEKYRSTRDTSEAFAYLRSCLEASGIFVLLIGDLGSHHSKIGASTFRGYSLADPIAPLITINDNDARPAWAFTTLHETAHLWLGQSGVSGAVHATRVEQFCNDVAGRVLLPPSELALLERLRGRPLADIVSGLSPFASERKISRAMVAYQLLRSNVITGVIYQQLIERFSDDYQKSKAKEPTSEREGGGPNYYVVKRHRLGAALITLAQRSLQDGKLTPTKAAQLLAVKPISVHALLDLTAA